MSTKGKDGHRNWKKQSSVPDTSSGSKNPKIPDGLIMITGYTESGVDEGKSNFRKFTGIFENYTRKNYPVLAPSVADPFAPEYNVPVPPEIRASAAPKKKKTSTEKSQKAASAEKEDESKESLEPDAKAPSSPSSVMDLLDQQSKEIYKTEILKNYIKDCREVATFKLQLASDLWAVAPKALQDKISFLSNQEIEAKRLEVPEEEFDISEYSLKHSKINFYWLWSTINQIMSLGMAAGAYRLN